MSNARNLSDIVGGNFDIPANSLDNAVPANGSITTAKLADANVTTAKLADANITTAKIANDSVTSAKVADSVYQANKNMIINGGMKIWQRGTSMASTGNGSNNYTADRFWVSHNNTSNVTVSQQDGTGAGIGVQYCARVQRNSGSSAANGIRFGTSLEATDVIRLRGKTLTLSFYARAGANFSAASNTLGLYLYTGTDVDPNPNTFASGLWNNTASLAEPNSTLTTSWQRFTYTTNAVSSTANALILQFNVSETGTAGANDYFEITGIQLEEGDQATPYEHRLFQDELSKCQRYFTAWTNGNVYYGGAYGSSNGFVFLDCPVRMRAVPTVTVSSARVSGADSSSYNSQERIGVYMGATNPYIGTSTAEAEL